MTFRFRRALLVAFLSISTVAGWAQELTIEVVDDTGNPNSPYLLLVGKDLSPTAPFTFDALGGTLATVDATTVPNSATPSPINLLKSAGYSVLSPYTGQMRPVYHFKVTTIDSGAFVVFQNDGTGSPPFVYTNNANPSPSTANYRFDQCEITFNATIQSDVNLTSIDALSMPMQLDCSRALSPNLQLKESAQILSFD